MILLTDIAPLSLMNPNTVGLEQTPGISYQEPVPDLPRLTDLITLNLKQLNFSGSWLSFAKCSEITK